MFESVPTCTLCTVHVLVLMEPEETVRALEPELMDG